MHCPPVSPSGRPLCPPRARESSHSPPPLLLGPGHLVWDSLAIDASHTRAREPLTSLCVPHSPPPPCWFQPVRSTCSSGAPTAPASASFHLPPPVDPVTHLLKTVVSDIPLLLRRSSGSFTLPGGGGALVPGPSCGHLPPSLPEVTHIHGDLSGTPHPLKHMSPRNFSFRLGLWVASWEGCPGTILQGSLRWAS